jgi:hypothetical protein
MVFISHNPIRKCKYCDKPKKLNMTSGRNKGYYRTCGSEICKRKNYSDAHVNKMKGRVLTQINYICFICGNNFKGISANHKRYCLECVPDRSWRNRANKYAVGKKQWDALLEFQNGKCALCDKNPETVDHCHYRGIVRGLLCGGCNLYLSILDNNPKWIERALDYVKGDNYATFQKSFTGAPDVR